jgi:hypothetical protein
MLLAQVPSQEGRKNPNKVVKEVDEEEEENKMREEAGLTRYRGTHHIHMSSQQVCKDSQGTRDSPGMDALRDLISNRIHQVHRDSQWDTGTHIETNLFQHNTSLKS